MVVGKEPQDELRNHYSWADVFIFPTIEDGFATVLTQAASAGLPLISLILTTVMFLLTPLINTAVRVTEREADAFGINCSREPDGMAKVALKLGSYRKLDPSPLEEFIFFDHPSGRARIRMAMDWKAAHLPAGGGDVSGAPVRQ